MVELFDHRGRVRSALVDRESHTTGANIDRFTMWEFLPPWENPTTNIRTLASPHSDFRLDRSGCSARPQKLIGDVPMVQATPISTPSPLLDGTVTVTVSDGDDAQAVTHARG
jgi:hypothetical protein